MKHRAELGRIGQRVPRWYAVVPFGFRGCRLGGVGGRGPLLVWRVAPRKPGGVALRALGSRRPVEVRPGDESGQLAQVEVVPNDQVGGWEVKTSAVPGQWGLRRRVAPGDPRRGGVDCRGTGCAVVAATRGAIPVSAWGPPASGEIGRAVGGRALGQARVGVRGGGFHKLVCREVTLQEGYRGGGR